MLEGAPIAWDQVRGHLPERGHVGQPGEAVGQPRLGIDVVHLRGDDQRIHQGGAFATAPEAGEEP